MHLYLILKISNYVEFASQLEIYTFLTYKKADITATSLMTSAPYRLQFSNDLDNKISRIQCGSL